MFKLNTNIKALLICALVSACAHTENETVAKTARPDFDQQDEYIRMKMREIIGHDPLLEIIAGCESNDNPHSIKHRNKDGTLVKNPKSSASGALQVLLIYHSDWIKRTGLNMQDDDDYFKFVKIMRTQRGYVSWNPSKHCWGEYEHLAIK